MTYKIYAKYSGDRIELKLEPVTIAKSVLCVIIKATYHLITNDNHKSKFGVLGEYIPPKYSPISGTKVSWYCNKGKRIWPRYNLTMNSGVIRSKNMQLKLITNVMDIRYKDSSKRFNNQCELHKKTRYKWTISEKQLLNIRNNTMDNSSLFDSWQLKFDPHKSKYSVLALELYTLPSLVNYIVVKVNFMYIWL